MKKIVLIFSFLIVILSCDNNDSNPDRILKNIAVEYLYFDDGIRFINTTLGFSPANPLETICSINYKNNAPVKIIGGFRQEASGYNLSNFVFSEDVSDSIVHDGGKVIVYTIPKFTYYISDNPDNPLIYSLSADKSLQNITRRNGFVTNYAYSGNIITETNSEGDVLRKFYLENNNLVKVEQEYFMPDGDLFKKIEILFKGFDNNPNPLQDKYYLIGAFFRAFSVNNFEEYTINTYFSSDGINLELQNTYTFSMPINYDMLGYPLFGEYQ